MDTTPSTAAIPAAWEPALRRLQTLLGPKGWTADPADLEPHLTEQRGLFRGRCAMLARPVSTAEVAETVAICAEAGIPVVPQGGNTGLVGGGVPEGGVLLSLARLNRVRAVDAINHTMTVEAGCVLGDVQARAAAEGMMFPLSLGAEGSCQIGGNLATNAGGTAVLRYGNARDLVVGLEVVLADGRVWDGLRGLRKDNTGYDLKQVFLGSEGTLGIITAAVLKLFPPVRARETALAAAATPERVLALFAAAQDACGDRLTAFEMVPRFALELTARHIEGVRDPMAAPHRYYVLIELTSPRADDPLRDTIEGLLARAIEDGTVEDAVIGASDAQRDALWRLRETIPEAQKREGASIKHDVAVPVSRIPEFLAEATRAVEARLPAIRVCAFGHVGDGNIHFNLSQPVGADGPAFLARWDEFNRVVHDLAVGMGGSFSAEHGIGRLKRGELVRYKPAVEIDLMRSLKAALDPRGILNPGKVV